MFPLAIVTVLVRSSNTPVVLDAIDMDIMELAEFTLNFTVEAADTVLVVIEIVSPLNVYVSCNVT